MKIRCFRQNPRFQPKSDVGIDIFERDGDFIVCTSTYGSGDIPDSAREFFDALQCARPSLGGVEYAVFGLGDSTYQQTYGFGGHRFDELLAELGARRIAPLHVHNASGGTLPEDDCVAWAESLAEARRMAA